MVPSRVGRQWAETVENKASVATTTLHFCRSNWETGSGVKTHKTQTEFTIVASVRHTHTDWFTATSCIRFPGGISFIHFIIIVVFVFCCVFDSFGNETTSTLTWNPKRKESLVKTFVKTQHLHWNKHSKDYGNYLCGNHLVKVNFLVVRVIWQIAL